MKSRRDSGARAPESASALGGKTGAAIEEKSS
jgi:hypothetical protein